MREDSKGHEDVWTHYMQVVQHLTNKYSQLGPMRYDCISSINEIRYIRYSIKYRSIIASRMAQPQSKRMCPYTQETTTIGADRVGIPELGGLIQSKCSENYSHIWTQEWLVTYYFSAAL